MIDHCSLGEKVKEAWEKRCSHLTDDEKLKFTSFAAEDITSYTTKLAEACQQHKSDSKPNQALEWFEPLFHAVGLLVPVTSAAVQAYPNPGSLVLGGVILVLDATKRVADYQKLTIQMLQKMSKKAEIVSAYQREVYKDDYLVQMALVHLCGCMLDFCSKAVRQFEKKGKLQAKVKGVVLSIFRDFNHHLGEEVNKFNQAAEELCEKALLCDKRRLQMLQKIQEAHQQESRDASSDNVQRLIDIQAMQVKLWERQKELEDRKCFE